ncbi:cytidine deaminase [Treponema bryantii]|jgi:cytidine deaminase|uniref:Cytidine deaminase n=1 Tax=Treponema bryantii TaxID=163 RepID=A0A1I3MH95_9SPIR|nr:cytidine deaminase [Treponema bryantii]SFI96514.1 cytidine deaminase [Treponema bryantii]
MNYDELVQKAIEMTKMSYVPYSHFHVGAALLDKNGKIWTGCNIENATYGATNCAERTAIFKAVSEGVRDFEAIAIVGGPEGADGSPVLEEFCPPCGICRQVLSEFCSKDFKIILANKKGEQKLFTLAELLPESFSLK